MLSLFSHRWVSLRFPRTEMLTYMLWEHRRGIIWLEAEGFLRVRDLGSSWKKGCLALVPLDSGSLTPENLHPVVHHFHSWCVCCQLEVSVTEQPKASENALKTWHPSVLSYNLLKVQFLRTKKTLCFRERSAHSFRDYQWSVSGLRTTRAFLQMNSEPGGLTA